MQGGAVYVVLSGNNRRDVLGVWDEKTDPANGNSHSIPTTLTVLGHPKTG